MDAHTVDNWIEAYKAAWNAPGTETLAGIFSKDISYKPSPFKSAIKGLEALAEFWEKSREPGEEYTFTHLPVANEGDTSVIRVEVGYKNGEHWKDIWIMQFDAQGLCFAFEEWPCKPGQSDS